jgi:hypothetical protein
MTVYVRSWTWLVPNRRGQVNLYLSSPIILCPSASYGVSHLTPLEALHRINWQGGTAAQMSVDMLKVHSYS